MQGAGHNLHFCFGSSGPVQRSRFINAAHARKKRLRPIHVVHEADVTRRVLSCAATVTEVVQMNHSGRCRLPSFGKVYYKHAQKQKIGSQKVFYRWNSKEEYRAKVQLFQ